MTYIEFKNQIIKDLREYLPSETTVTFRTVFKNNDMELDGLVIMEPEINISPTLYLNYYYEEMLNGTKYEVLFNKVIRDYENNKPEINFDTSLFYDFAAVKDKVVFKIVNTSSNKHMLSKIPHIEFLDLSIIFYIIYDEYPIENGSILVQNNFLQMWDIDVDEIHRIALYNTPKLLPGYISNIIDIASQLADECDSDLFALSQEDDYFPMYVLTNEKKTFGASAILYPDILKVFSDKIGSDLYILPSSIHEVILVPAFENLSVKDLFDMVSEVNDTLVMDEEILSDNVYRFIREESQITCCAHPDD